MTTTFPTAVRPRPFEGAQVTQVACLLLAIEAADLRKLVFKPIARLGEDFVAATVMIDVGEGAVPFDLECIRLAAQALRFDPPFPAADAIADRMSLAADQAQAAALRMMAALH